MQPPQILIVDDDPHVLASIERSTRGHFTLTTALDADAALEMLRTAGSFAVVVSDLRMPRTDGIAFLKAARRVQPDAVRILLTGQADLDAAEAAVNDGEVFRFLRKPCPAPVLRRALQAAIEQYDLVIAKRELLEGTLQGTIRALAEVLAATSPTAFARAVRVRDIVGPFAQRLGLPDSWQVEVAALLSQLGAATLPAELAQRMYHGQVLTERERELVEGTVDTAATVVANVPRLEMVRDILVHHRRDFSPADPRTSELKGNALPVGARILRIAFDFDVLLTQGHDVEEALILLARQGASYDPELLSQFTRWQTDEVIAARSRAMTLGELHSGLVLAADVVENGVLLIARGQRVTPRLMDLIHNYWDADLAHAPVRVALGDQSAAAVLEMAGR